MVYLEIQVGIDGVTGVCHFGLNHGLNSFPSLMSSTASVASLFAAAVVGFGNVLSSQLVKLTTSGFSVHLADSGLTLTASEQDLNAIRMKNFGQDQQRLLERPEPNKEEIPAKKKKHICKSLGTEVVF